MNIDVIIVGGGIAGATLATVLARSGRSVLILERETKFKDRLRGENMLPWGVAVARRLGVLDELVGGGGHAAPFFNVYAMGTQTEHRPLPETTPTQTGGLNIQHPDMQEIRLAGAEKAGAALKRGASVQGISETDGKWTVTFVEDGQPRSATARLVVRADGRSSRLREWGGFTVQRDPEDLRIAGAMVHNTMVPDDGVLIALLRV